MTPPLDATGYRAIKAEVLSRIHAGIWPPGAMLPGETKLAEEFSTTRTTINRALRELAEEGVLERKRKAGTRVLKAPKRQAQFAISTVRHEVERIGGSYRYARVSREKGAAPLWLSTKLALPNGSAVVHVRAMHYSGSCPYLFEDRWIVLENVPGIAAEEFLDTPPNEWLIEKMPFTNAEISMMASKAGPELAAFLELDVADPVFLTERITWLQDKPITFVRLHYGKGYRMTTRF